MQGSGINFIIIPRFVRVGWGLWFGAICCFISFLFAIQLAFWDWKAEKIVPSRIYRSPSVSFSMFFSFPFLFFMILALSFFYYVAFLLFIQNSVFVFLPTPFNFVFANFISVGWQWIPRHGISIDTCPSWRFNFPSLPHCCFPSSFF